MEPTTNTKSRSVSPTLCINYDSRPIMGIIVALVAAKAGFHVGAVVGILFDPCCITRTTMTRMNRVHRNPDGQPFSAPAYTRDVFDTAHILHFDYAVGQRLARTSQLLSLTSVTLLTPLTLTPIPPRARLSTGVMMMAHQLLTAMCPSHPPIPPRVAATVLMMIAAVMMEAMGVTVTTTAMTTMTTMTTTMTMIMMMMIMIKMTMMATMTKTSSVTTFSAPSPSASTSTLLLMASISPLAFLAFIPKTVPSLPSTNGNKLGPGSSGSSTRTLVSLLRILTPPTYLTQHPPLPSALILIVLQSRLPNAVARTQFAQRQPRHGTLPGLGE